MTIRFTWNSHKATQNRHKHGVDFEEAATVFRDRTAFVFDDDKHSEYEYREQIIGYSHQNRLLIVVFVEIEDVIRIISARRTNPKEREIYEKARR